MLLISGSCVVNEASLTGMFPVWNLIIIFRLGKYPSKSVCRIYISIISKSETFTIVSEFSK